MSDDRVRPATEIRARRPEATGGVAARRAPDRLLNEPGRVMVSAADHTARGMPGAAPRAIEMADRGGLLDRLRPALSRTGVTGLPGTPDVIDGLLVRIDLEDPATATTVGDDVAAAVDAAVSPLPRVVTA